MPRAGFEPAAFPLGGGRSIRLSYRGARGTVPRPDQRGFCPRGVHSAPRGAGEDSTPPNFTTPEEAPLSRCARERHRPSPRDSGRNLRADWARRDCSPFADGAVLAALSQGQGRHGGAGLHRRPRLCRHPRAAHHQDLRGAGSRRAEPQPARRLRPAQRAEWPRPLRHRPARTRRLQPRGLRVARVAGGRLHRHGNRRGHRRDRRPVRRLLPRLGRHRALARDGRLPRLPGAHPRPGHRRRLLAGQGLLRRARDAGPAHGDLRHRLRDLALHGAHRARPGPLVTREGVRRGRALAGRARPADPVQGDPAQPRRADHRLRHGPDPSEHPVRGRPVVPRRRHPAAGPQLGPDDLRRARDLRHGVVVHDLPRHRAAAHRARLQPRRRRAPGRPEPAHGQAMTPVPIERTVPPMRRVTFAAVAVVALLVVAGCGGGSNNKSSTGSGQVAPKGGKQGGRVTVLLSSDVDYLDPGHTYYTLGYAVAYPTQRPLYSFKPGSNEPVPDLADGPPQISSDNKTVTVKMKSGIKFSPPVNREVQCKDVKYAFERAFTANVANEYTTYFTDIAGAPTKPGSFKSISGITCPDPNTLVIKLSKPAGVGVAAALVMPITVPVPQEYAKTFDAKNPSTYNTHVVSTGPYMVKNDASGKLTGYKPGASIQLVRNPNWDKKTDFKPAYLDSILIRTNASNASVNARQILTGSKLINASNPPAAELKLAVHEDKGQYVQLPGGGYR